MFHSRFLRPLSLTLPIWPWPFSKGQCSVQETSSGLLFIWPLKKVAFMLPQGCVTSTYSYIWSLAVQQLSQLNVFLEWRPLEREKGNYQEVLGCAWSWSVKVQLVCQVDVFLFQKPNIEPCHSEWCWTLLSFICRVSSKQKNPKKGNFCCTSCSLMTESPHPFHLLGHSGILSCSEGLLTQTRKFK